MRRDEPVSTLFRRKAGRKAIKLQTRSCVAVENHPTASIGHGDCLCRSRFKLEDPDETEEPMPAIISYKPK
jgi:hypothetical protein